MMLTKTITYLFLLLLNFSATCLPQSNRYTKGAENGYTWLAMDDPNMMYNRSKENYLSSILDRLRLTGEKHPEIASLSCRKDVNRIFSENKTDDFSLEDVVREIDQFYLQSDNLIIPIIFAYCHTIKKFAGASSNELKNYRANVLKFCNG